MPHTTHKKKAHRHNFLPPSCCLKCSQYAFSWNICLCLLHTQKSSASPSFIHPIPSCKASMYFWLLIDDPWGNIPPFYRLAFSKLSKNIPLHFVKKEVGRATPGTFTAGRKTLVLIDTSLVCVHRKTASKNVSKPQFYSQRSLFWWVNMQPSFLCLQTQWFLW